VAIKTPDYDKSSDDIKCCSSCANGSCPAGSAHYNTGSAELSFSLGTMSNGQSAGSFYFHEQDPGIALSTPAGLKLAAAAGVWSVRANNVLRQIKSDAVLADIVAAGANNWEIRFYKSPSQVGVIGSDGLYNQTGKIAYQTIAICAQSVGSVFDRLVVTETGDLGKRRRDFVWQMTDTTKMWTLQFMDDTYGILRQQQVVHGADVQGRRTVTHSILDASNIVVSRVNETYEDFAWGEELVLESTAQLDSTGASLGLDRTVARRYYLTTDSVVGCLVGHLAETYRNAGEKWVQYQYDSAGRISRRREQFLDCPRTAADSECRVFDYAFSQVDIDGDGKNDQVTVETQSLLGRVIGRSADIWWKQFRWVSNSSGSYPCFVRTHAQATDLSLLTPTAIYRASNSLRTDTQYRGTNSNTFDDRICSVLTPDGLLRLTQYTSDTAARTITTTVYSGQADAAGNNVTAGTKTVTVKNSSGGLLSESSYTYPGNLLIAQSLATAWDSFGRPIEFRDLDNLAFSQSFSCCGLQSETDRDGVTTVYERDNLQRLRSWTRGALTSRFTLDPFGRTTKTQRCAAGSTITTSSTTFDSFGSARSTSDALNRTSTVADSTDSSGHRVVTTTAPGGATRIETFTLDGALLSVAGTAAAPVHYEYGADASGALVKETRLGSDTGSGPATTEWTRSYTDFAGRPSKTVYADAATSLSFYNPKGQLSRSVDPDGVQTLYDYDSFGRLSVTALDMDRDGVIDFDGTDRITRQTRSYSTAHGATVERTVTDIWSTANSAAPTTVATIERAVDGLHTWTTANGLTASTATVFDSVAGTRTEIITAPDLTSAVRTFTAGRLTCEARLAVDSSVLEIVRYGYDAHGRLTETRRYADSATATADLLQPSGFSLQPSAPGVLATVSTYFDDDQLHTVTTPDPDPTRSGPGYDPQTTAYAYDDAGRPWKILLPDLTETLREYFPSGRLRKTYGSLTYPQEFSYDSQGRLKTLTTWQNYANAADAAVTTWAYDPARGWLTSKTYPGTSTSTSYSSTPAGRPHTRTWARTSPLSGLPTPVSTTYAFNNAGDLSSIDYSDATPDVAFGYDRLGRRTTTTDAAGLLTTAYEGATSLPDAETYAAASPLLPGLAVARTRDALLRPSTLSVPSAASVPSVTYSYQPNTGRLDTITAGALTHTYAYQPQSSLIATLTQAKSGATVLTTTKVYDHLYRLTSASSLPATQPSLLASYQYNSANQRTRLTREDAAYWSFGYDSLGQVTAATKHLADATTVLGLDQAFTFDDIGNRLTATSSVASGATGAPAANTTVYSPNLLNQYTQRTVPPVVDVLGTAHTDATVTVNFLSTQRQGERWLAELPAPNAAAPAYIAARVLGVRSGQGPNGEDAVA
jgi:YD repeat-containing protein